MSQNRLKIQAQNLDLELTGDAAYVGEAYEAIRDVIVTRFEQTLRQAQRGEGEGSAQEGGKGTSGGGRRRITRPLYRIDGVSKQISPGPTRLRLVVCNDLYHKVAVLRREELEASVFGEVLDSTKLESVFINEAEVPVLERELPVGKTLWRELTATGRRMVKGDSS